MSFDWDVLEETLYEFAASQLRLFARDHDDETFYAFAFCCNAFYGEVMLSLNCEAELQNPAPTIYAGYPPEELETHRWSIGDWRYMETELVEGDELTNRWNSVVEEFTAKISDANFDDDDDERDNDVESLSDGYQLENEFLRRACLVVLRLESDGVFECLRKDAHFTVYAVDHDETDFDSWKRLTKVRIEFAPPWKNGPWPIPGRHAEMAAAIFAIAAEYHQHGQQLEAAHLLREAIARLPEFGQEASYSIDGTDVMLPIPANQAFARAYCYRAQEIAWHDDEALEEAIETAIRLDADFSEPYFLRARQLAGGPVDAEELDAAAAEVNRAIDRNPNEARYFGLRGEVRSRPYHPFYDDAVKDYSRAIELEPRNEEWLNRRAKLYVELERPFEAIDDFTRIFEIWNSHVSWRVRNALQGRAECLQKLEKYAEAAEDWTRLIGYDENPKYLAERAKCYRALGDETSALQDEHRLREAGLKGVNAADIRASLRLPDPGSS